MLKRLDKILDQGTLEEFKTCPNQGILWEIIEQQKIAFKAIVSPFVYSRRVDLACPKKVFFTPTFVLIFRSIF